MAEDLFALAAEVEVLDVAGRLIANPVRAQVSRAAQLAMAHGVENFWALALAGYELARLHQRRQFILSGEAGRQGDLDMDRVCFRMDALAAEISAQVAGHRGDTQIDTNTETNGQETEHGKGQG